MKKKILSALLTFALVLSFMPVVTQTADAATAKKSTKVQLVTKATDDDGYTVKYTYNKKRLVSKSVSSHSSNYADESSKNTVTTTYKYNKKNRITRKTAKSVTSNTEYKTDPTTGKRTTSRGTVTTTRTSVTSFKYKKGRAIQSVTTSVVAMSGSDSSAYNGLYGDFIKLSDGRYYDRDEDKYYTAAEVSALAYSSARTTSYKDNGNGTYTETEVFSNDTTPAQPETIKDQTVTTRSYKYNKKKRVKQETVSVVRTYAKTYTDSDGDVHSNTTVTTEAPYVISYAYDKKGRLKKETLVDPNKEISSNSVYATNYADGTKTVENVTRAAGKETRVMTVNGVAQSPEVYTYDEDKVYPSRSVYTYKYDKNGNMKSSKTTNTETSDHSVYDSVYGGVPVYMINADGSPGDSVTTPVSTVEKKSASFTNTLKKGTKTLLKKLGIYKSSTDGYSGTSGAYSMGQIKYKVKARKVGAKLRKDVELQQWMIQNGVFCGVAGL